MHRALYILATLAVFALTTTADSQELFKINGIEIPVSDFKAKHGGKPESPTYYGYHFSPRSRSPSPYIVVIPSSREDIITRNDFTLKAARRLVDNGYGVVVIDINRGVTGSKSYNGLVGAPPRSIGALSMLQYIRDRYPQYSNGRFGAWGRSKGGGTTIEINKVENHEGAFLYRNVKHWFDALAAYYPTCGDNELVAPQLIVIGEIDDWTPPANCRAWQKTGNTKHLQIHYMPNAGHAFDNPAFKRKTMLRRGFAVQYNPAATEEARGLLVDFFDNHLKFKTIDMKDAQRRLTDLGYEPGGVDGAWGPNSVAALRKFQRDAGLPADGVFDTTTQANLLGKPSSK